MLSDSAARDAVYDKVDNAVDGETLDCAISALITVLADCLVQATDGVPDREVFTEVTAQLLQSYILLCSSPSGTIN